MRTFNAAVLVLALGIGAGYAMAQDRPNIPDETSRQDKEKCFDKGSACAERDARAGTVKEGELKLSADDVRKVQQVLSQKGTAIPNMDGTLNEQTVAALKTYQKANDLKVSGDFNVETLHSLGFDAAIFVSSSVKGSDLARTEMKRVMAGTAEHPGIGAGEHERARSTDLPAGMPVDVNRAGSMQNVCIGYIVLGESQIKSIQKRLKTENYFTADVDGAITNEFIVGVRTFQTQKKITSSGLIDFATLAAIPEVKIDVVLSKALDYDKDSNKSK